MSSENLELCGGDIMKQLIEISLLKDRVVMEYQRACECCEQARELIKSACGEELHYIPQYNGVFSDGNMTVGVTEYPRLRTVVQPWRLTRKTLEENIARLKEQNVTFFVTKFLNMM